MTTLSFLSTKNQFLATSRLSICPNRSLILDSKLTLIAVLSALARTSIPSPYLACLLLSQIRKVTAEFDYLETLGKLQLKSTPPLRELQKRKEGRNKEEQNVCGDLQLLLVSAVWMVCSCLFLHIPERNN